MKFYMREVKAVLLENQSLRGKIESIHSQIATYAKGTQEQMGKVKQCVAERESKRVSYDYYRGKMQGLEKTHKESQEPKKKERWLKNMAKQIEVNKAYTKVNEELNDCLNVVE